MEKQYTAITTRRSPRPRSKRLREQGGGVAGSGGSTVVFTAGGGGSADVSGDGHTHPNKRYLDQLTTDTEDYIYLTQYKNPEDGSDTMTKTTSKARAGYADEARDLAEDSPANDRFLRKDQDDRTEHSIGVGGSLSVEGDQAVKGDSMVKGNAFVGGNQTVEGAISVKGLLSVLSGAASPDFLAGLLGTGFKLSKNSDTGRWCLEVDELMVRVLATFFKLVIHRLRHVGGSIVLTPASMECVRVEDRGDAYRCYFKAAEGEKTVENEFVVGDQARSQSFNLKAAGESGTVTSFYWRLVKAVGDDWIDLSKDDCAAGSCAPQAGDEIVQLGNRTDTARQNAIILDTTGSDAPSIKQYKGISGYSLTDEMVVTVFSPSGNRIKGQFVSQATGEDYDQVMASVSKQVQAVRADMDTVKAQTDREFTIWFFETDPTADNLPASEWTTDAMKREHVEDIYYNRVAGHAWRWRQVQEGSYAWDDITDQESLRALETAAKAQDTADGKRRNFVAQPTNDQAYDIGDTWSNATYGELYDNDTLVCVTAKAAGEAFSIAHWQPASNATTAYIQNLGAEIRQVVADNKAAADTAVAEAQQTANEAKGAAAQNASAIVQNKKSINALSARFTFDDEGNVMNIDKSGLLLETDAATLYTRKETTDELGRRVIVAEAKIETSVQKDSAGNIESSARISADQITMNGTVKFATQGEVMEAGRKAVETASDDAQRRIDELKTRLGELAYKNLISLALLDETIISGGYIKTSLIDVNELVAKRLMTRGNGATVLIEDGLMNVYGKGNIPNIVFGVNEDGMSVLSYYDNSGVKLYDLGPTGIKHMNVREEKWVTLHLMRSGDTLEESMQNSVVCQQYIEASSGRDYFKFISKMVGSVVEYPDDDQRVFTSMGNRTTKIADGWYVETGDPYKWNDNQKHEYTDPGDVSPLNPPFETQDEHYNVYYRRISHYVDGMKTGVQNIYFSILVREYV